MNLPITATCLRAQIHYKKDVCWIVAQTVSSRLAMSIYSSKPKMDQFSILRGLSEIRISPPAPETTTFVDPLTVQESDLERRCLGILTDALRALISYAHSSFHVPIAFQVKRFDRARGQTWVKVAPEEVPEGYDLKYLLQHMKFYENMPKYVELLKTADFSLRSICQYFLDLLSRAGSPRCEESQQEVATEISKVKETIAKAGGWVQEMMKVGLSDRDVVRQLTEAQTKLRDLNTAVDKYSLFHQNQSEALRQSSGWWGRPERTQAAARSVHQQMLYHLNDPEVAKYVLHVVAPRLGLFPCPSDPVW